MSHTTYVRSHRKRWALSQRELARMLGSTQSIVSRCEQGSIRPDIRVVFGLQVVFGLSPQMFFPGLYSKVEEAVMANATQFDRLLAQKQDTISAVKQALLESMSQRAGAWTKDLWPK